MAFFEAGFAEPSDQARFRAADRRNIEKHADVRSDADASGMGDPLAVHENEVGFRFQPFDGMNDSRPFPEREKSRDVGKCDPCDGRGFCDEFEVRI